MEEKPSIQQLENFIIYGKVRNFTLAAKDANITQSAFSSQMKKLEELVGVKLIARSNRGSDLTSEGKLFLERVNHIMDSLSESIYEVRNLQGKSSVDLQIGILTTLGDVLMNQHVVYFQKNNSNIFINVYDMEEEELLQDLKDDRIDIGSTFLLKDIDLNGYVKTCFCSDNVVYYAPGINDLPEEISRETMLKFPMVQYPPKYFMNAMLQRYFLSTGEFPPVSARLSTPYAVIYYCQKNRAAALLPERLLNALGIENGYYKIKTPLNLKVYLLYKKENPKYWAMKIFVNYIMKLNQKNE